MEDFQNISILNERKTQGSSDKGPIETADNLPIDFELGCWIEQMQGCAKKIDTLSKRQSSKNWIKTCKD